MIYIQGESPDTVLHAKLQSGLHFKIAMPSFALMIDLFGRSNESQLNPTRQFKWSYVNSSESQQLPLSEILEIPIGPGVRIEEVNILSSPVQLTLPSNTELQIQQNVASSITSESDLGAPTNMLIVKDTLKNHPYKFRSGQTLRDILPKAFLRRRLTKLLATTMNLPQEQY